jgi:predicted ATPase
MTTFIKELLDIPEQVQRGDFVLRLSEGVNRAEETLRDYVVTPELQACFDNALSFISSAVHSRTSKASYLHGSFGSGKSHFMAVLHLILQGNLAARSIPELAPVISKHNVWAHEKKFPHSIELCGRTLTPSVIPLHLCSVTLILGHRL